MATHHSKSVGTNGFNSLLFADVEVKFGVFVTCSTFTLSATHFAASLLKSLASKFRVNAVCYQIISWKTGWTAKKSFKISFKLKGRYVFLLFISLLLVTSAFLVFFLTVCFLCLFQAAVSFSLHPCSSFSPFSSPFHPGITTLRDDVLFLSHSRHTQWPGDTIHTAPQQKPQCLITSSSQTPITCSFSSGFFLLGLMTSAVILSPSIHT